MPPPPDEPPEEPPPPLDFFEDFLDDFFEDFLAAFFADFLAPPPFELFLLAFLAGRAALDAFFFAVFFLAMSVWSRVFRQPL